MLSLLLSAVLGVFVVSVLLYGLQIYWLKNASWTSRFRSHRSSKEQDLVVLFVIAHPDDECMFFGPSIMNLNRIASKTFVQCLSTGNANGLGSIRKKELFASCAMLGIPEQHVILVDDKNLPDDPTKTWEGRHVAEHVAKAVQQHGVTTIVTFDERGVSGHRNHIWTYHGICEGLQSKKELQGKVELFSLVSHSTLRKYMGLFTLPLLFGERDIALVAAPRQTRAAREAMQRHASQFVWFRRLYVLFSSYMFVNILKRR